jgi:hypothetical protein
MWVRALRTAAAALALLAFAPGPAGAAGPTSLADDLRVWVPTDAPTVLTGPGGETLIAFMRGPQLCFALTAPGQQRPSSLPSGGTSDEDDPVASGCPALPVLTETDGRVLSPTHFTGAHGRPLDVQIGVTGTGVATVQAKRFGTVLGSTTTVASPLPGAAAELRFYVVERPEAGPDPDMLALLDAGGTVRRALPFYPYGDPTSAGRLGRSPRRTLARGGRGAIAWHLDSYRQLLPAPTPLEPERYFTQTCLRFTSVDRSSDMCDEETLEPLPAVADISAACGPVGLQVTVLARARVRRAALVLGDGSRRAIALRAVPGTATGLRGGVAVLGPSVAIRRLVLLGAHGALPNGVVPVERLPASPGPCDTDRFGEGSSSLSSYELGFSSPLTGPGPHVLHAADHGVKLCAAFDRAPRIPDDCSVPEVDYERLYLSSVRTPTGLLLSGLVPAEVAGARVTLDDGTTREVVAAPLPGYAGRYAAVVRTIITQVDAPRAVADWQLLDARGRVLAESLDAENGTEPRLEHVRTVLRTPGLPPLRAGRIGQAGDSPDALCLTLGPLAALTDCDVAQPGLLRVRALCAPRRIVIYGMLSHGDQLFIETAAGREVAARQAVLPTPIRAGKRLAATLVVLPAGTGARRMILRGRASGRRNLVLPPAAAQCGYQSVVWADNTLLGS